LYQSEGTSMFAGCLPALAQWPVLSVLYLLFRSPRIAGAPNTLLSHGLFGAPLGSRWLSGAGPLSAQGAVFAGLFLLLAVIGWLSARLARRIGAPIEAAQGGAAASLPAAQRGAAASPSAALGGAATSLPAALARVLPYFTVVVAAFVPLAAGVYLLTTTAWTLAERVLVQRALAARAGVDGRDGPG
jgi:YidC/Oxa1 family membrane protein insertase